MKFLKLIIIGIVISLSITTKAQVSLHVNIGSPPMWGPAGYSDERYYYLPDIEAYYDVNTAMFIYVRNGVWIHRAYLPSRYRNYDLYGGYKVVMRGYRGESPYDNFNEHRMKYARGYRGETQRNIGERRANPRGGDVFYNGKTNNRVKGEQNKNQEHNDNRMKVEKNKNSGHIDNKVRGEQNKSQEQNSNRDIKRDGGEDRGGKK